MNLALRSVAVSLPSGGVEGVSALLLLVVLAGQSSAPHHLPQLHSLPATLVRGCGMGFVLPASVLIQREVGFLQDKPTPGYP